MRTREVPRNEWASFCEQFSRIHHHKPVNMTTTERELGVQPNARDLPLIGITTEQSAGGGRQIGVMLGEATGAHLAHTIERPSHLRVAEWNDDYSAALQIESEDGSVTLLQVGPEAEVLPPGVILDGIVLP
jgi:hypothetical protein